MRKWMGMLLGAIAVILLILTISCKPAVNNVNSYAEDRAQIEDLQLNETKRTVPRMTRCPAASCLHLFEQERI